VSLIAGYAINLHRSNEEVICFHSVEPPWISAGTQPRLPRYSDKIQPVSLRKYPRDTDSDKAYFCDSRVRNVSKSFAYKMAAKNQLA